MSLLFGFKDFSFTKKLGRNAETDGKVDRLIDLLYSARRR